MRPIPLMSPIRDDIHGLVEFNAYEHEIIDSPYYQRLHFVLQNSLNYVSFPTNKTSRFIHSIGVAKLAGDIFSAAIRNSDPDGLESVVLCGRELIQRTRFSVGGGSSLFTSAKRAWLARMRNSGKLTHPKLDTLETHTTSKTTPNGDDELPKLFVLNILWCSLRVCGLVHDIGHLPMSHSFEHALDRVQDLLDESTPNAGLMFRQHMDAKRREIHAPEHNSFFDSFVDGMVAATGVNNDTIRFYINNVMAVHELRGFMILDILKRDPIYTWNDDDRNLRTIIYSVAQFILFAASSDIIPAANTDRVHSAVLRALKQIISGEVDSDRLDYTIRDAKACSSDIGSFDLGNIVRNAVFVKKGTVFHLGFLPSAIAPIEQFFERRYEGYKYLIYNITSARSEAVLQELVAQIISISYRYPRSVIAELLKYYGYLDRDDSDKDHPVITGILPSDSTNLQRVDDSNLRTIFFEIYRKCLQPKKGELQSISSKEIDNLIAMLEVVLFRDFSHLYNPTRGQTLQAKMEEYARDNGSSIAYVESMVYNFLNKGAESISKTIDVVREFAKEKGVIVLCSVGSPRLYSGEATEPLIYRRSDGTVTSVSTFSPMLREMNGRDRHGTSLTFAYCARNIRESSELIRHCEEWSDLFMSDVIVECFKLAKL